MEQESSISGDGASASADAAQGGAADPYLDVYLVRLAGDPNHSKLFRIRTLDWLIWVSLMAICLMLIAMEVFIKTSGSAGLDYVFRIGIVFFAAAAAFAYAQLQSKKASRIRFTFASSEEPARFVWLTENGISFGVPLVWDRGYAWVYFKKYRVTTHYLDLYAGGGAIRVDLRNISDKEKLQIKAGLARAFSKPRLDEITFIHHCMGCGYDLTGSLGPACPECGKPIHDLNKAKAR